MPAKLEAKMDANNEKFEVLKGTLVSQMDAHQARTEAHHKMMAMLDAHHERVKASVNAWQNVMSKKQRRPTQTRCRQIQRK
jgi:hypothetical protein